ncbi:MAG: RNB domain-containing ribonuclease [Candidatus Micrarchaeota archaeon]|nr:RNB domain-containing ribonuclease [Candidatus Micrarchaeota archaeon]
MKVAIADVDAFAPKGSVLDMRAQTNAILINAEVEPVPMLPERLSKDLSSLPMENDRLAMVVEFAVLRNGNVRPGKIYRAIVRNRAALAYDDVGAWLLGEESAPEMPSEISGLAEQIKLQDEASIRLSKYREMQGALGLEAQEAAVFAKEDWALGLTLVEENRAKRLVENFMICASRVMLGFLEGMNIPAIHKVVNVPKDWSGLAGIAHAKGFELPTEPDVAMLLEFIRKEQHWNRNSNTMGNSRNCPWQLQKCWEWGNILYSTSAIRLSIFALLLRIMRRERPLTKGIWTW